jgi:O-acetylhomoserine (thiol)-lyase
MTRTTPAGQPHGFATRQVHAGRGSDGSGGVNARATPIYLSAGFVFDDFDQARDRFGGADDGFTYTRIGNPTNSSVERRIAALESGREAILVGSGQAAVSVAVLALLKAGDHLVSANSIYEGSRGLFVENFGRLGIETSFVAEHNDPLAWELAIRPSTRALFVESIPNPKNDLVDLALVAGVAHRHGIPLIVDNTFATPYLLRPLEHGADVVVHSASKFLAGHGSVLGGAIVSGDGFDWAVRAAQPALTEHAAEAPGAPLFPHLAEPAHALGGASYAERFGPDAFAVYARDVVASRLGPTPSPLNAFLIEQGIETLSLRVDRQSATALAIARWLDEQPGVESVDHAGLASNPHHALALRYLPVGQGSVFSFTLSGGAEAARRFIDSVALFTRMTHLGDVRSLIIHPASTTHAYRSAEQLAEAGIWPGLIRLSIGVEDAHDLLADLAQALEASGAAGGTLAPAAAAADAADADDDAADSAVIRPAVAHLAAADPAVAHPAAADPAVV